jgi:hypothetical protein
VNQLSAKVWSCLLTELSTPFRSIDQLNLLAGEQILRLNGDGGNILRLLFLGWDVVPQRIDERVGGSGFK